MAQGNVSAAQGQAQVEMFGNADFYNKVILVDDKDCPIDENTALFVDKEVELSTESVYVMRNGKLVLESILIPIKDYVVKQVASYPDFKAFAIDKVKVS